ncbi:Uncharacterised protein [Mycobacteroides abscessus subsp. abscessus]|nr:Uncharacterised protein [Mycobacteroides abscessus subsp. abscessus]
MTMTSSTMVPAITPRRPFHGSFVGGVNLGVAADSGVLPDDSLMRAPSRTAFVRRLPSLPNR